MPETSDKDRAAAALAPTGQAAARWPTQNGSTWKHRGALAAAYKALYVATGRFSADLSEERLKADIFDGAPMGKIVNGMPAIIDDDAKTVSVSYAEDMPPRIAAWRPVLGSTQLPIGAGLDAVKYLPSLPGDFRPPASDELEWPNGDRNAAAPGSDRLDEVVSAAFEPSAYGGVTWGVAVLQGGKIISERYSRGYDLHTPQRTNSVAKSVAATVIGAAVKQGLLDVHARPALREWSQPGDPRGAIAIDDLLHMASGLYTEAAGDPQLELYFGGAAAAERAALNIMDSRPGSRWIYAGSDTILAIRALREALGDDAQHLRFPFEQVLWKIGMTRTILEVDWKGDFLMSGDMWSTVRDMARLALLYAGGGAWNGEQILPRDWPTYVATPASAQPTYPDGRGYGAQFWLFGPDQGLPEGCYTADGARGQYAMVVPSHDLIVVRRGFDLKPEFKIANFVRDVIEAVQ